MTEKTKYQYEKRIRELQKENDDLRSYKNFAMYVYEKLCELDDGRYYSTRTMFRWFKAFGLFR